ncbi:hypothetical protein M9435_006801 [Picochlorum sp. BPE23]|nr:hypothetical protein M9435_006801 [Picochlorum sp. BPE23]
MKPVRKFQDLYTCVRASEVYQMPTLVWTREEDEKLRGLVRRIGENKWADIAREMETKTGKQCRRRWKNALTINAKTTTWSEEEDQKLIRYHKELGNKWTEISRRFGDRTDNAAKNRWSALCRKHPSLVHDAAPVTLVGVKRGTRTHTMIEASSSERSSVRQRRERVQPAMQTRDQTPVGAGVPTLDGGSSLPTPFDQRSTDDLSAAGPADMLRRQIDPLLPKDSRYHNLLTAGQMSHSSLDNTKSTGMNTSHSMFPKDILEASDVMRQYLSSWPLGAPRMTGTPSQQMPMGDFYSLLQSASQNLLPPGGFSSSNSKRMMMGNGNSSDILDNLSFTSASSSLNSEQRQILETLLNQQSKSGVEISPPVQMPVGKPSEDLVQLVSNFSQSEIESLISFLKGNEQKQ